MTETLFLVFLLTMAAAVVALTARFVNGRAAAIVLAILSVWLIFVGALAYFGVLRNPAMRPPGVALVIVPVAVFLIFFALRSATPGFALAFPLWILIAAQSFRILVELFLHQLWIEGLVPKMLTFAGANVDIYIGATAPLFAWLAIRGRSGLRLALVWNIAGLCALANVVTRSILTAPGPFNHIQAEVPNRMMATFPYVFIPAFFVPLAVVLHILALRTISVRLKTA
jgi:hypothetical protein